MTMTDQPPKKLLSSTDAGSEVFRRAGSFVAVRRDRNRAFTLLEVLVVIGILVILAGLAIVGILHAIKQANKTRMAADLQVISSALQQYKQDFGDYPRVEPATVGINDAADRPNPKTGWQVLCQALMGPCPGVEAGAPAGEFTKQDGADGYGFRVRGTQGKTYGPYIPPERFKVGNPANPVFPMPTSDCLLAALLDKNNQPICYLPLRTPRPDVTQANLYISQTKASLIDSTDAIRDSFSSTWTNGPIPPFWRNGETTGAYARIRFAAMLGDIDANGSIGAGETANASGDFILWAAGDDGLFGPSYNTATEAVPTTAEINKCDDVTTVQQP
jgi:prepilin-type N-terminal cleavage/methylation domain-containing protein